MEQKIKDSRQTSRVKHSIDVNVNEENFRLLEPEAAEQHLTTLVTSLHLLSRLVGERFENQQFSDYLGRLGKSLEAIVLRNKIESMKPNSDVAMSTSIDPTYSGFPTFVRDWDFLQKDKEKAEAELAKLPTDEKLVDRAEFSLFRGIFPKDIVLQKLQRNYFQTLAGLDISTELKIYPPKHVKEVDGVHYYTKVVERLDTNKNIPRMYVIYFRVPHEGGEGYGQMNLAILKSIQTIAQYELRYMATMIEDIEGVQLQQIERFDAGPVFTRHTENPEGMQLLLENGNKHDAISSFGRYVVQRVGQKRKKGGLWRWIKNVQTGDADRGIFSPILADPVYYIMPHRLIQVYQRGNIDLGNAKIFGITDGGDLIG